MQQKTIENLKNNPELKGLVKGLMIESFIKQGNQNLEKLDENSVVLGGLSITDPCLGWDQAESLLLKLADEVDKL